MKFNYIINVMLYSLCENTQRAEKTLKSTSQLNDGEKEGKGFSLHRRLLQAFWASLEQVQFLRAGSCLNRCHGCWRKTDCSDTIRMPVTGKGTKEIVRKMGRIRLVGRVRAKREDE